jgi:adenylate kinase
MASAETTKTSEMLADVSVQDLMAEVQRRLDCAKKPEKRLILIGPPGLFSRSSALGICSHCLRLA